MADLNKLMDELSELSVLEAAELVKLLEEKCVTLKYYETTYLTQVFRGISSKDLNRNRKVSISVRVVSNLI